MAEKSLLWTTGATGDGTTPYTQAEVIRWQRQMMIGDDTDEGVHLNYQNELEVTGAATPIQIDTGAAIVYGFPYWNTSAVNKAVATPAGNTRFDRVVLQADWTAQTVRIAILTGTEGVGTPPAVTQTDGVTWEISLATYSITTGGVITMTDTREWLHPNIEIETTMIEALAVTTAKIDNDAVDDTKAGNRVPQLYRRQGGNASNWDTQGSTDYTPTAVRIQCGRAQDTPAANPGGWSIATKTITFPVAFSQPPLVIVGLTGAWYSGQSTHVASRTITASQFDIATRVYGGPGGVTIDSVWIAIGPE